MLPSDGHTAARCWLDVPSELRACTHVGRTSLALHSQVSGGNGALLTSVALSRSAEQLCAAEERTRLPSTSARNSVPTSPAFTSSADRRAHFASRLPVGASVLQKRSFEEDTPADGNAARAVKPSTLTKLFTRLHRSRSANTHADHPVLHSKDVEVADSHLALSSERVSPESQVAQGRTPLQTLPRFQLELDEVDRLPRASDPPNIGLLNADRQSSQTQRKRLSFEHLVNKLASLWRTHAASDEVAPIGNAQQEMERLMRHNRPAPEIVTRWGQCFENLLSDPCGLQLFRCYLRTEFSDENIEFWIACEQYKRAALSPGRSARKMAARAQRIYQEFVAVQAPREVNLDSKTRLQTMSSLSRPSAHTFEQSQRRIESLMEKDSYQRFLRSDLYHALFTCRPAPSSTTSPLLLSPQPPSPQQQHIPPLPTASSSSALSPSPVRSPRSSSRPGLLD